MIGAVTLVLAFVASVWILLGGKSTSPVLKLTKTLLRLLFCKGRRTRGVLTGIVFPICLQDLTESEEGPKILTSMLRHTRHLSTAVNIVSVDQDSISVTDGVKGQKGIIHVTYDHPTCCPTTFFVKCNIQGLSPMRLLMETSEVCKCEAMFYHSIKPKCPIIDTPECYFVDYSDITGEFCLITECINFGQDSIQPLKHRIRDPAVLEEQLLFIDGGAALNASFRGTSAASNLKLELNLPRFEETHEQMWILVQLIALLGGLKHTTRRTLQGSTVNKQWMTWRVPEGIIGREMELIWDMPMIMRSLCQDEELSAYGHNDFTTDNAFFPIWR